MSDPRTGRRSCALLVPLAVAGCLAATGLIAPPASAAPASRQPSTALLRRLVRSEPDPALRAANAAAVAKLPDRARPLPHFSSTFTTDGVTFRYTMLGAAPESGRSTRLRTVIVPLVMRFTGFGSDVTFDPSFAVLNILRSPIYRDAGFLNGRGQFADQFQRAQFEGRMAPGWHTLMAPPTLSRSFTITVTPKTGQLEIVKGKPLGNMKFGRFNGQLHRILPLLHLAPDQTPVFVTQAVTADALGFHDAFTVPDGSGGRRVQTLMYTSWLDRAQVGDLLADVSTLNHEVAEWVDDPFLDNRTPPWAFPPKNRECGGDFLEVGDPQGNGPDFRLFPAVPLRLNGFTYHLQDLALLQWFTREVPSSAFDGWYSFPDPTQLTSPSVDCPPPPSR